MTKLFLAAPILAFAFSTTVVLGSITNTASEFSLRDQYVKEHLRGKRSAPPFSFFYGEEGSDKLLRSAHRSEKVQQLDSKRKEHVITWDKDNLRVRCVAVEYADFPVVEWTIYFTNTGTRATAVLRDIQGLDTVFAGRDGAEFLLSGIKGDSTSPDSFQPYETKLEASSVHNFAPLSYSGKSTSGPEGWPYYNLQMPGKGLILAIGWPGEWASSFSRDASNGLRIKAGQQLTRLYLNPGEEIRTPLIAMLFSDGADRVRGQNLWRRWYRAHVLPRVNGEPVQPITQIQVDGSNTNFVNGFLKAGIHVDVCWRDAGGSYTWYPNSSGPYKGDDAWLNTGTWEVEKSRYPHGFKPYSDWIHAHGLQFLLWFEPERVGDPGSWLGKNHPEWLMPGASPVKRATTEQDAALHAANQGNTHGRILNEGDPAAFHWLTNQIESLIKSEGIDWYREDMNGDGPLPAWRNHDETNRLGLTENLYVQGHLAFYDALRAMNPGLKIDACASGGRRIDLEIMRRAVPLTRSDFQFLSMDKVVEGNQCHTYGLSYWLPYQGSGCRFYEPYTFRTFYMAEFGMCDGLTPSNIAAYRQAYAEVRKIAPLMVNGDYYPLTPYSLENNVWMAWQFDCPEEGKGCVQAFRRPDCTEESKTFRLSGLEPSARYQLTNFDVKGTTEVSGKQLMEEGLPIQLKDKPGSAIIVYKKVGSPERLSGL